MAGETVPASGEVETETPGRRRGSLLAPPESLPPNHGLVLWIMGHIRDASLLEIDRILDDTRRVLFAHKFLGAPLAPSAQAPGVHWTIAAELAPLTATQVAGVIETTRASLWATAFREVPPRPILRDGYRA